jgi:two-component sensor histidine kinase
MDREALIKTLLEEAANARAWFAKYAQELKYSPKNERILHLQELCRQEFEKRWDQIAELRAVGSSPDATVKRPRIDE